MKFSKTHEWILVDNGVGTVGVTHFAQKELGDIVYVELPKVGKTVKAGEEAAVLESTKAAADVYTPVSGTILEINPLLKDAAELVNASPEDKGWLFKIQLTVPEEMQALMEKEAYMAKLGL